jgi:hypothetical protein
VLICVYAVENEIGISHHRDAAMPSVVDEAAYLREKAQGFNRGFDGAKHIRGAGGISFEQICRMDLRSRNARGA